MRKIKNILILAGGDSTRFWPLTDKVVFPFLGTPLINYIIEAVSLYTSSIIVVVHPNIEKKMKKIIDRKALVIPQKQINLGMAGAILATKDIIKNEEVLIINGSDLLNFSFLSNFLKKVENFPDLIITAKEMQDYFPGGYLKFDRNKKLFSIVEKPPPDKRPSFLVKLVVDYFLKPHLLIKKINQFKEKSDDLSDDLYEKALTSLFKEAEKIEVFNYQGDFYSLKYPWQVLNLTFYFLSKIKKNYVGKNVLISKKATIIEPVYLSDGVKIGDYAKVVGPTFIGKNSIIADYALINKSHIGEDCLIGGYSEVTRSYLGNKVFLHRNYVGDSVLADKVLLGAGVVLANFRFDAQPISSFVDGKKVNTELLKFGAIIGKESKMGVNSASLPGIKIGSKTFIGPGEVIKKDIEDNKFIFNNKLESNLV